MIIYKITCKVNGKVYIGQTTKSLERRWKEHVHASRTEDTLLYYAMRKHGIDYFEIDTIEICNSRESLNDREKHWIEHFLSFGENGYNATAGGQGCIGYQHSEEMKTYISEANKGRVFSEEHRKKLSEALKARMKNTPHSEESRKKMGDPSRGRKLTEEHRAKLVEANKHRAPMSDEKRTAFKANMKTPEAIENRKVAMKGFKHSEETKQKMSEMRKGRKMPPRSEEQRRRYSEAKRRLDEERKCKQVQQETTQSHQPVPTV